jgi:hypothetical protein
MDNFYDFETFKKYEKYEKEYAYDFKRFKGKLIISGENIVLQTFEAFSVKRHVIEGVDFGGNWELKLSYPQKRERCIVRRGKYSRLYHKDILLSEQVCNRDMKKGDWILKQWNKKGQLCQIVEHYAFADKEHITRRINYKNGKIIRNFFEPPYTVVFEHYSVRSEYPKDEPLDITIDGDEITECWVYSERFEGLEFKKQPDMITIRKENGIITGATGFTLFPCNGPFEVIKFSATKRAN